MRSFHVGPCTAPPRAELSRLEGIFLLSFGGGRGGGFEAVLQYHDACTGTTDQARGPASGLSADDEATTEMRRYAPTRLVDIFVEFVCKCRRLCVLFCVCYSRRTRVAVHAGKHIIYSYRLDPVCRRRPVSRGPFGSRVPFSSFIRFGVARLRSGAPDWPGRAGRAGVGAVTGLAA